MKFGCEIAMNNAAFADISDVTYSVEDDDGIVPPAMLAAGIELARILRRVADDVETGVRFPTGESLLDANGRTVGRWSIVDETAQPRFVVYRGRDSIEITDGYVTFKTADEVADAIVVFTGETR